MSSDERRVRLRLEYLGTAFHGWQAQPGVRTAQGALVDALASLSGQRLDVRGASRTDAGVHARDQVAAFTYAGALREHNFERGLNVLLPDDIAVTRAEFVEPDFHPRHSALGKRYRYRFADARHVSPFERAFAMYSRRRLDAEAMHEAAQALVGEHDFSSFRGAGCDAATPVRTVWRLDVVRPGNADVVELIVEGNAFLKYMVRNLAGALLDVGRGHRAPGWIAEVLALRDRTKSGPTAEPQGLTLERVFYAGEPDVPSEATPRLRSGTSG